MAPTVYHLYFLDFQSFNFEKLFEIEFLTYFYLATSLKPLFNYGLSLMLKHE